MKTQKYLNNAKIDNTLLDNGSETHNINIAVAAATTAYARIFMSQFKNNPKYIIYYTDTDSIFIASTLDDTLISDTELGKLKLEYVIKKAIFLAPKCYWLQLQDGTEIIRIKGVKKEYIDQALANHSLKFENFAKLLFKDEVIQIEQDKWFRDYCNANISISKVAYTIKQTQNKRELIYDGDICVDTKPLVFEKQSFKDLISKDFL